MENFIPTPTEEVADFLKKNAPPGAIVNLNPEIKIQPAPETTQPSRQQKERDTRPRVNVYRNKAHKLPASIPLSSYMLPPITRRSMAIYQLIDFGMRYDRRVIEGSQVIDPQPYQLHPIYQCYDRFEEDLANRIKIMVYSDQVTLSEYTDQATQKRQIGTVAKIEMPEFVNGQKIINTMKEYVKYCWWELHPGNASNKFRESKERPFFKRVDIEYKSPHLQMVRRDLSVMAERYVIELNKDELINLGAKFGITPADPEMRYKLRTIAFDRPEEVMYTSTKGTMAVSMNILKALDLGIIDYFPEKRGFLFPQEEDEFFLVPVGQEPVESLAKYMIGPEGAKDKKDLEDYLSFWN